MKNIDDNFKKRFHNEKAAADNFDAEGLWDDISANLDEEQSSKSKLKPFLFILLLLLIAGTISSIYFYERNKTSYQNDLVETEKNNKNTEKEKEVSSAILKKEKTNKIIIPDETISSTTNSNVKVLNEYSLNKKISIGKNEITNINLTASENTGTNKGVSKSAPVRSGLQTNDSYSFTNDFQEPSSLINSSVPPVSNVQVDIKKDEPKQSAIQLPIPSSVSELQFLPSRFKFLEINNSALEMPKVELAEKQSGDKNKKDLFTCQLGLWGGTNNFNLKYTYIPIDNSVELIEEKEAGLWGMSVGTSASVLWKERWLISSGLEYHKNISKFDYLEEKNIEVLKEDHPITLWIDANRNDTIKSHYADTMVNALSTRQVIHYNKYTKFSVPIEIGFQQNTNNFLYGLAAGPVLDFYTTQKGKALSGIYNVIAFDQKTTYTLLDNFNVGLRVSPLIGYKMTDKLNVIFSPKINFQFNKIFYNEYHNLKVKNIQTNLNLGIYYTLK